MPNIPGIEKTKTMQTTDSRSMPPNMNQAYIDMFMLRKERERLEKEGTRLDTKREQIVERLKKIEKDMARLEKEDKQAQKEEKRDFDWDAKWVKMPKETKSEEAKEEPKKPKVETGWKIRTVNRKEKKL